jgi:hypothetical protein
MLAGWGPRAKMHPLYRIFLSSNVAKKVVLTKSKAGFHESVQMRLYARAQRRCNKPPSFLHDALFFE